MMTTEARFAEMNKRSLDVLRSMISEGDLKLLLTHWDQVRRDIFKEKIKQKIESNRVYISHLDSEINRLQNDQIQLKKDLERLS